MLKGTLLFDLHKLENEHQDATDQVSDRHSFRQEIILILQNTMPVDTGMHFRGNQALENPWDFFVLRTRVDVGL